MSYKVQRVDFLIDSDYLQKVEDFLNGKSSTLSSYKKSVDIKVPKEIEWLNNSVDYKLQLFISEDEFSVNPTVQILLYLSCNGEGDDVCYSITDIKDMDYTIAYGLVAEYFLLISVTREIELNLNTRTDLTLKLNENIGNSRDYTLGVLMKNSLNHKIERLDFLLASLFHLEYHSPCDEIILDYIREKLAIYGYDEDFYIDLDCDKKNKSSEDIFNSLLYILLYEIYDVPSKIKIHYTIDTLIAIQNNYCIYYFKEEALKSLE